MARSVTLKGNAFALEGPEIKVGDSAPNARLRKDLLTDYSLDEATGKPRIFSVVPSLDTPVCATQTRRFSQEAAAFGDILWFTISCDLPVAMTRFCGAEGIDTEKVYPLSDHKYLQFGNHYGTLIPDLRILCRAVFIADSNNAIVYAEYVPEISEHPNYEAILTSLRAL